MAYIYIIPETSYELAIFLLGMVLIIILNVIYLSYKNSIYKKKIKRHETTTEILNKLRINLKVEDIKNTAVQMLGKELKADRCIMAEYDYKTKKFSNITSEYLSSDQVKGMQGQDIPVGSTRLTKLAISNQILFIEDTKKYIKNKNLQNSAIESFYKEYKVKSAYGFPVRYSGEILGILVINYTQKARKLNSDDIIFFETAANSLSIALHQSQIYEKIISQAQKETILRKLSELTRDSTSINELKKNFVNEIGKILNASRCIIRMINKENGEFFPVDEYSEYRNPHSLNSVVGLKYSEMSRLFMQKYYKNGEELIIYDFQTFIKNDPDSNIYTSALKDHLGSLLVFPIKYENVLYGGLFLHYIKQIDETLIDLNFVRTVVNQISIAINKIQLQADLQESLIKEKIILNNIPFMAWLKNKESRYITVNDSFAALFNTTPENIIGKTDFELFPEEQAKLFHSTDLEVINMNQKISIEEEIMTDKGNRWNQVFKSPVYDDKGNVVSAVGLARDITQEREDAKELFLRQEKIRKSNEREKLQREITTTIRSTLDISQMKRIMINLIGKSFNADECLFLEAPFLSLKSEFQYEATANKETISEYVIPEAYAQEIINKLKPNNAFISFDVEEFNKDKDNNNELKKLFVDFNVKTQYVFGIFTDQSLFGCIVIIYNKNKIYLEDDDINLLKSVAEQASIGIKQALLYEKEKETAQRERLMRDLISTVRSTLDINKTKKNITKALGKSLGLDRCFIMEYNQELGKFIKVKEGTEYLSSNEMKSAVGVDFYQEPYVKVMSFIEPRYEFYLANNKEITDKFGELDPELYKIYEEFQIKSGFHVPVYYGDEFLGTLIGHSSKETIKYSKEKIDLIRTFAHQTGVAIYQAELYEKEKNTSNREKVSKSIIEIIRSTLDKKNIKNQIVNKIGEYFNADRVLFSEYDTQSNMYLPVDDYSEYLANPYVKSFIGYDWSEEKNKDYITPIINKQEFNIQSLKEFIKENNMSDDFVELFEDVKSSYNIPVLYFDEILGYFCIEFTQNEYKMTNTELDFIRSICNQTGIALYQSSLYEKEKKTAEREKITRNIIEIIRSTLDKNIIKQQFVNTIGKHFNADRVLFSEYDPISNTYQPADKYSEYLSGSESKSYVNFDWSDPSVKSFSDILIKDKEINIFEWEKYKQENKPETGFIKIFEEANIKSSYNINISYQNEILGFFCIDFSQKVYKFSHEELEFIRSISNQAAIAIYQANLYEKEKQAIQKERLIRKIVESARSTLDIDIVKKNLVYEVGKAFNADRCYFVDVDLDNKKGQPVDENSEYRTNQYVKSIIGYNFPKEEVEGFVDLYLKTKDPVIFKYKKIVEGDLENYNKFKNYINTFNLEFGIGFPFYYLNKLIAVLAIEYVNEKDAPSKELIEFLKILGNQVGLVMNQVNLYDKTKKTAEKERILRAIVSKLKISLNLKQAYNILMEEIGKIFNLERVVFLESSASNKEELIVKYEYTNEDNKFSENNIIFPQICIDRFLALLNNLETLIINDIKECYADESSVEFFEKYNINSLLAVPLVKINRSTKIFGFIVLCGKSTRKWKNEEIDLLKSISDSIVSVIWEITKVVEIDEIRNSFVLTLAHDLQVPLVGERKALEFLLHTPSNQPIEKYKILIEDTVNNNLEISERLKKLVDIYNYELKRKQLDLSAYKIQNIVEEVVYSIKDAADEKEITIVKNIPDPLPEVEIDKNEIYKVMFILVNNAITYTPKGGIININGSIEDDLLQISVKDTGIGINPDIQARLFKQYQMAIALDRKIGAGLNLYLSKQILQAHNGDIWFKTIPGQGTEFYFTLPIKSKKPHL